MAARPELSVAILSATRTPIGRLGGALKSLPAPALGAHAARAAVERSGIPPAEIEEVLFGNGLQAGVGQNPARQVSRGIGIPDSAGAATVNMVCGSGLKAINLGFAVIRAGEFQRVLVGGMESMSNAPHLLPGSYRFGSKPGPETLDDAMQRDGLMDAYGEHEIMGLTGERVARHFHLTRADVDAFALRSNRRAARAVQDGSFAAEVVPVPESMTPGGKGLARDECPRPETSLEALGKLRTAFGTDGVLTAGNSSQISDGAAALVLASRDEVERRGLKPLAWVHSTGESGVHPDDVMEAPIPTVRKHLERVGLSPSAFDRVEHNEAFASASIAVQRTFGFTEEQFNVHGGAVALGHPIGASGARIVVTLVQELVRSNTHLGLATACMGGGNGLSLVVDRTGL
ncbi:MAG TPA: thiolase family protein [Thermoplasmata archaeon]|jgi:acetyl-CoA C-acetyltransferase|nr:thiolase family protein [Thermoplasmata archaeon]